jgi:hypothetical protein
MKMKSLTNKLMSPESNSAFNRGQQVNLIRSSTLAEAIPTRIHTPLDPRGFEFWALDIPTQGQQAVPSGRRPGVVCKKSSDPTYTSHVSQIPSSRPDQETCAVLARIGVGDLRDWFCLHIGGGEF